MELTRPISTGPDLVARLNREMPPGLAVQRVSLAPKKSPDCVQASYAITLPDTVETDALPEKIAAFQAAASCPITRFRKGKTSTLDLKPLVSGLTLEEGRIRLSLIQQQGKPGASPREVLEQALGLTHEEALISRILKQESVDLPLPA